jgi:TonB family protein
MRIKKTPTTMKKIFLLTLLVTSYISTIKAQELNIIEDSEISIDYSNPNIKVPFAIIEVENAPVYPGCEDDSILNKKDCFQEKIYEHIGLNFKYPEEAEKEKIEGRVYSNFTIDVTGHITNIRTSGPHPLLEKEAKRIIEIMPDMITPGTHSGMAVNILYSLPITFKL